MRVECCQGYLDVRDLIVNTRGTSWLQQSSFAARWVRLAKGLRVSYSNPP